ncbi:MAG: DUF7676 family protein [Nitrospirales bacterium]
MDGSRIEYEYMEPKEEALRALLRELFETHWSEITFGPCIQGAVYEIRLTEPPRKLSMLDGYLTVDAGTWHFHLCIGDHRGPPANPVPEALARRRRAAKAAFFRQGGGTNVKGSWGFRMWNGNEEQMLTIFFPNPYLDEQMNTKPQPDWNRLGLWNRLRLKHLPGASEWGSTEGGLAGGNPGERK